MKTYVMVIKTKSLDAHSRVHTSKKFKDFPGPLNIIFKHFSRTVRINYKTAPKYIIFYVYVMSSY
jgi:hypothetical protein